MQTGYREVGIGKSRLDNNGRISVRVKIHEGEVLDHTDLVYLFLRKGMRIDTESPASEFVAVSRKRKPTQEASDTNQ